MSDSPLLRIAFATDVIYMGKPARVICDRKCNKAWGVNGGRPRVQLSDDPDDYAYLADDEVGEAPVDPGTYEGGDGKPLYPSRHNKWCARECERSVVILMNEPVRPPDLSVRLFNIPKEMPR